MDQQRQRKLCVLISFNGDYFQGVNASQHKKKEARNQ